MTDTNLIQKIRQQTGAGILDIHKALKEAENDEQKALEILKKTCQKIATKKQAERTASEGIIDAYVHANGKVAALIMLSCETDFVAKNQDFKNLAHDIAMQVAAMNPPYINTSEIPTNIIEQEKETFRALPELINRPADIQEKIITGKLNKFYSENCLLNQTFIKDDSKTIQELITENTAKLGEKIEIKKIIYLAIQK